MDLPAKNGNVSFNHKKHQDAIKDCKACHATEKGGKIEGFGKDFAHKTCKGCHETKKAGPTKCGECHKIATYLSPCAIERVSTKSVNSRLSSCKNVRDYN